MKKIPKLKLTLENRQQLQQLGKDPAAVEREFQGLCRGTQAVLLREEATVKNGGIRRLNADQLSRRFAEATRGLTLGKFVPASGAASRMFQLLLTVRNQGPAGLTPAENADFAAFLNAVKNREFAFSPQLDYQLQFHHITLERMLAEGRLNGLLDALIGYQGLNLACLPKALIPFHQYGKRDIRLSLEEHLREAAVYSQGRLHCTITPDHERGFRKAADLLVGKLQPLFPAVRFSVTFSWQNPASDAVALEADGSRKLFRLPDGRLLLRPAGHGALLANLNRLESNLIFIKNIDNVSARPAGQKATRKWQEAMAVYLLDLRAEIHGLLRQLDEPAPAPAAVRRAAALAGELHLPLDAKFKKMKTPEKVKHLHSLLNRPLRVAGMVKNTGEPGGGPFFIQEGAGRTLQIVEHGEMDRTDPRQEKLRKKAAYFNPTDLVVCFRDYRGRPFHLEEYRDENRYFISQKFHAGRPLLGYEQPGLWNGSMARWISLFVEVPAETFTPVKAVNDLLRPEHRA